jgi:shikimate kinase
MDRSGNVVLTGFMGTGKTTVGRLLAELLGYEFIDTDDVIERRYGAIETIFRERGEDAFRVIEREVADEFADGDRLVISTGGRMMLDPEIAATLGPRARVFCLVASPDTIAARVLSSDAPARPLLTGSDPLRRIAELLAERASGYARFEQVSTDSRTAANVAHDLLDRIRQTPFMSRSSPRPRG